MDTEFLQEYIDKLNEENNAILKEKVLLRAQVSLLLKRVEAKDATIAELTSKLETVKKKAKPEA